MNCQNSSRSYPLPVARFFLLILLSYPFIFESCKKKDDTPPPPAEELNDSTLIQGKIHLLGDTGFLITEANIALYEYHYITPSQVVSDLVDSYYTLDGKYEFNFKQEPDYHYYIEAYHSQCFNMSQAEIDLTESRIKVGKTNLIDIPLAGYAYLNLHIKNTSPVNSMDAFSCSIKRPVGSNIALSGMNIDTTILAVVPANKLHKIQYSVTKNSTLSNGFKESTWPAFDTTDVDINY